MKGKVIDALFILVATYLMTALVMWEWSVKDWGIVVRLIFIVTFVGLTYLTTRRDE